MLRCKTPKTGETEDKLPLASGDVEQPAGVDDGVRDPRLDEVPLRLGKRPTGHGLSGRGLSDRSERRGFHSFGLRLRAHLALPSEDVAPADGVQEVVRLGARHAAHEHDVAHPGLLGKRLEGCKCAHREGTLWLRRSVPFDRASRRPGGSAKRKECPQVGG